MTDTIESVALALFTAKCAGIGDPARLFRELPEAERQDYYTQAIRLLTGKAAA